jgi:hypothetical protein
MSKKELTLEAIDFDFEQFHETIDFKTKPLMKLASLYVFFEVNELRERAEIIFNEPITDDDSKALINISRAYKNESNQWILEDSKRNDILKSFNNRYEVIELYRNAKINIKETTQILFGAYINGEAPSLERQNMQELAATYTICSWLKGTSIQIPEEKDIRRFLKQKERLQPFIKLTRNFRGREDELRRLKDYVDYLPKKSLLEFSESFIRSVIGWHEKPPLVIKGIGGAGKSTLIAKFILDHLDKGTIPFIYFDFDRPGLSLNNTISLVIEGLRQLALQFPNYEDDFLDVSNSLKSLYLGNANASNITRSTDRQILYECYFKEEKRIPDIPILIVFDSFEEIQYRASNIEISNLFNFLRELSDHIPRLRYVFAGRSDISYSSARFDTLALGSFDREATYGYLQSLGIQDPQFQEFIYKKVGGHPLSLQLAADLILKEQKYKGQLSQKEMEQLFSSISKQRKQEELIKRNLDHIHDDEVRAIAIPGILVRRINPEVIQKVLAYPCGFEDMSIEKGRSIFEKLKKETFLLNEEGSEIFFSQELRCALYQLIIEDPNYKANQIHNAAVEYYGKRMDIPSKAEYLYHRLMRGDSPDILENLYEQDLRPYLENSLTELPDNAYVQLSRYMNAAVLESRRGNSDQKEWEDSVTNELINFFNSGDEFQINDILKLLQSRKERSSKGLLNYYETKFLTRIGKFNAAKEILDKQIIRNALNKSSAFIRPMLLYAKLHEFQQQYKKAYNYINEAKEDFSVFYKEEKDALEPYEIIDLHLTYIRLAKRQDLNYLQTKESLYKILNNVSVQINSSLPKLYNLYFKDCNSLEEFERQLEKLESRILPGKEFDDIYKSFSNKYKDSYELEKLLQDVGVGVFLKDITEPGVFKILLYEALLYCEAIGLLTEINRFNSITSKNSRPNQESQVFSRSSKERLISPSSKEHLTGKQKGNLIDLISARFDPTSFTRLLTIRLEKRLTDYAAPGDPFQLQIFRVIQRAEIELWEEDLINALLAERPNDAELINFIENLRPSNRQSNLPT